MKMPGREYLKAGDSSYRYGFNGQEKSDEIGPNTNTAEFWEYDARLGRRWNIDPKSVVWSGTYTCLMNNPINYSDILGDTVRAYSDKTGDLIGTTYGKEGNYALVVKEDKVAEVQQLLKNNDVNKDNAYTQNGLEDQLKNGNPIFYGDRYGILYDVNSLFNFYDNEGSKYKVVKFQSEMNGNGLDNFKDLLKATLNGKQVDLKTFEPKGAEVEGNLVYKNGIVSMGVASNFRTSYSLNSQYQYVPSETDQVSTVHTHPGINFKFVYHTKETARPFNLTIIPNLPPSGADYDRAGNLFRGFRFATVSSDVLVLYANGMQPISVDRKIK